MEKNRCWFCNRDRCIDCMKFIPVAEQRGSGECSFNTRNIKCECRHDG